MTILTALLAFVVTMIVLSTMVTAIVQVIYRILASRKRHLRHFFESYFEEVIAPKFGVALMKGLELTGGKLGSGDRPGNDGKKGKGAILRGIFEKAEKLATCWPRYGDGTPIPFDLRGIAGLLVVLAVAASLLISQNWAAPVAIDLAILIAVVAVIIVGALRWRAGSAAANSSAHAQMRHHFVQEMTAIIGAGPGRQETAENISAIEFASRLARSKLGRIIAERATSSVDTVVTDLLRRFDALGDGSMKSFAMQSRLWSLTVAFVLTFVANVDAIAIIRHFAEDPESAARVAALGEQAVKDYQEAAAGLDAYVKQLEQEAQDGTRTPEQQAKAQESREELKELLAETRKTQESRVETLAAAGVPIGWSHYPFCQALEGETEAAKPEAGTDAAKPQGRTAGAKLDARCRGIDPKGKWFELRSKLDCPTSSMRLRCWALGVVEGPYEWLRQRLDKSTVDFIGWLFGAILAGALVGLGGPFWFDIYRQLSAVTQMLRGLGIGGAREPNAAGEAEEPKPKKAPETAHHPDSAVEAFCQALEAEAAMGRPGRRRRFIED